MGDIVLAAWHEAGHLFGACFSGVRVREAYVADDGEGATVMEDSSILRSLAVIVRIYAGGMTGAQVYLETRGRFTGLVPRFDISGLLASHPSMRAGAERDIAQIGEILQRAGKHMSHEEIYREAREEAELIMTIGEHYTKLKHFADALLEKRRLNSEEIIHIWNYNPPAKRFVATIEKTVGETPKSYKIVGIVVLTVCFLLPLLDSKFQWSVPRGLLACNALVVSVVSLYLGIAEWTKARESGPRELCKPSRFQALVFLCWAALWFFATLGYLAGREIL